jgi:membrane protein implicated in regulation of membrane protease activity
MAYSLGAKRLMQIRDQYVSVIWEIVRTVLTIGVVIVSCFVLGILTLIFPWLKQVLPIALITIFLAFVVLVFLSYYRFLGHNNQPKGSDPNNRNDDQDGLGKPAPILPISPLQGAAAKHLPKEETQQGVRGNRR